MGVLGLLWCALQWNNVSRVQLCGPPGMASSDGAEKEKNQKRIETMEYVSKLIKDGAESFLFAEYFAMGVYIVVFSIFLFFFTNVQTTISFVLGGVTSILCGYIGMMIAVKTNVKTTHESWMDLAKGFDVAIQ